MKIGVLGSGTMGAGIVQTFAQAGYHVIMRDLSQDKLTKAMAGLEKNMDRLVKKERISQEDKTEILGRISTSLDIEDLKDVGLLVEAAVEDMAIKKEIFKTLDKVINEDAILATNTSSLSITEIACATSRPDKVIGMHFFNPVPAMKLVEVIKGISTSEKTQGKIIELTAAIGKTPVVVEEAPGFVVNRLLIPMINEAIGILSEGVASSEDIDQAMKLGANHPLGPLALADLIGNDVNLAIMETLYTETGDSKYRPHPLLKKMVRGNLLGRKTKQGFFTY